MCPNKPIASGVIFNGIVYAVLAGIVVCGLAGVVIDYITDSPNHGKYGPWWKTSWAQGDNEGEG